MAGDGAIQIFVYGHLLGSVVVVLGSVGIGVPMSELLGYGIRFLGCLAIALGGFQLVVVFLTLGHAFYLVEAACSTLGQACGLAQLVRTGFSAPMLLLCGCLVSLARSPSPSSSCWLFSSALSMMHGLCADEALLALTGVAGSHLAKIDTTIPGIVAPLLYLLGCLFDLMAEIQGQSEKARVMEEVRRRIAAKAGGKPEGKKKQ